MNIIEKYYMRKASMSTSDTFYEQLEPSDIQLLKNAQMYLFIAPAFSVGIVHLLSKMRTEMFISKHFHFIIKKYQDRFQSKYRRNNQQQSSSEYQNNEYQN